jgi:Flp pilus assembly protein TadD
MLLLRRFGFGRGASAFGGLFFALHPAHVESYAWIAERKDVLSALFFLLALHAWLSWMGWRLRGKDTAPRKAAWAAALLFFALSLLAKPMTVTLPAVLLLLELWPGRRDALPLRRRIAETVPFFLLAGMASAIAIWTQRAGGAMRTAAITTPLDRAANAITAWSWSLRTWIAPRDLAVFHPWSAHGTAAIARDIVILGAVTALARLAWRRLACGPRSRSILVGWLWFVGMILPVSGIVQVGLQSVADRYLYLPGIGLLIALLGGAGCLLEVLRRGGEGRERAARGSLTALAAIVLIALALLSHRQFAVWRASESLFRQAVSVHPDSAFAHHLLGLALAEEERWPDAAVELRRAIELQTGGGLRKGAVYETWLAPSHAALSAVLRRLGRAREAAAYAERATILAPRDAALWFELGEARAAAGGNGARDAWSKAAALAPSSFDAHFRLGIAHAIEGDAAGSIRALDTALRLRPRSIEARVQLALSLVAAERYDDAAAQLDAARAIDRAAANAYLQTAAGFAPRPDNLERYAEYLRRRAGVVDR